MNGPFTNIEDLSDKRTYIPTEDDLGKYLQVTVEYVDSAGPDIKPPLKKVTAHAVRKDVSTTNDPPQFPDQTTLGISPDTPTDAAFYVRSSTDRFILENSPAPTRVGAPVTAFDDAEIIELLTYKLSDGDGANSEGHAESFRIDAETGQITVSPSAKLGAEVDGRNPDFTGTHTPYQVKVTATDGDGSPRDIDVNIWVVGVDEPPMIGRNYIAALGLHLEGERVPTEMSHYELDRVNAPARQIDTDLGTPDPKEAAIYYARDSEDADTSLTWSLAGDDATRLVEGKKVPVFTITGSAGMDKGANATLAFAEGPDFEKPWNKNTDQVYEVTIVVTDSIGNTRTRLPVTVKVINSTEDNKPGKVTLSNRVPEVKIPLKATVTDPDKHKEPIEWQWYRTVSTSISVECDEVSGVNITPVTNPEDIPDDENQRRYYVETDTPHPGPNPLWEKIDGAGKDTYSPKTVYQQDDQGIPTETIVANESDNGRCLRATVTYQDGPDKFDPTEPDNRETDGVDESLEGTWVGTEFPVKAEDNRNNEPVFTDTGGLLFDTDGNPTDNTIVGEYEAERFEGSLTSPGATLPNSWIIDEVKAAIDEADLPGEQNDEVDTANDTLTYSLGRPDAKYFVILGSVEYPTEYDPDGGADPGTADVITGAQGTLIFKLNANGTKTLDYETKKQYVVTVFATDPSGDGKGRNSAEVTVTVIDVNEGPKWVTTTKKPVVYKENNDVGPVFTFKAEDKDKDEPETQIGPAGMIYDLVEEAIQADEIEDADIVDHPLFEIDGNGVLSFKSPPNYENPKDNDTNNMYQGDGEGHGCGQNGNPQLRYRRSHGHSDRPEREAGVPRDPGRVGHSGER